MEIPSSFAFPTMAVKPIVVLKKHRAEAEVNDKPLSGCPSCGSGRMMMCRSVTPRLTSISPIRVPARFGSWQNNAPATQQRILHVELVKLLNR